MINNQFSRRNLPTKTRLDLAYRFKEFEVEKAKERQGTRNDLIESDTNISLPVGLSEVTKGKTLEAIAQKAGVSRSTAEQYDAIQRKGTKEQKEAIRNHEASIKKVYTQIQEEKRPKKSKTLSRSKNKLVPTIQENITNIYSSITNHQGLTDINYWLTHSALGNNENYLEPVYKIHHQRGLITKNLNQLSELVDDLEIFINQCKNLLLIEKRKDKQFARDYDKYYSS
jgi:transcriptional regulator with XRE-family HTH domain